MTNTEVQPRSGRERTPPPTSGERRKGSKLLIGALAFTAALGASVGAYFGDRVGVDHGASHQSAIDHKTIDTLQRQNDLLTLKTRYETELSPFMKNLKADTDGSILIDQGDHRIVYLTTDKTNPKACNSNVQVIEHPDKGTADLDMHSVIGGHAQDIIINGPKTLAKALNETALQSDACPPVPKQN